MKKVRAIYFLVLIIGLCVMNGCTASGQAPNDEVIASENRKLQEKTCNLGWRIEADSTGEIVKSYLYLYSKDNEKVEFEVGYLEGEVFDIEKYKDRYPEDGIMPIASWYGGAGVEVVGRCVDENTLYLTTKAIGDNAQYSVNWDDFDDWYKIDITYNDKGEVESLVGNELMDLNGIGEETPKAVHIDDFIGKWKVTEVAWEPEQHNYIGEMDQIIGSIVSVQGDFFEMVDDKVENPEMSLEMVNDQHFLCAYAGGAELKAQQYTERYGLRIEDSMGNSRYMYYMDGEIWCEYKGELLLRVEKTE